MKQKKRGGKRPGAGRPPLPENQGRVQISIQVRRDTLAAIDARAKAGGLSRGAVVDGAIEKGA